MSFKATIEADIKGFTNNIDKAIGSVDKLEKTTLQKLSSIGNSFVSIGKRASILSVALVGVGAKAFSMAADFEDALGATGQIFKDNSDTVQDWANSLDTSYGIAKKEALEYSNLMGSMLINIGNLTEEQASKQSAKLIELAGDLTAMYGGTTQDAVRALTGALKGNNTMLDNYGMAVNEALIKQKALELGLISGTSEMGLQAKQAATLALIWEQTGAAQGQAAREADGASGAMRKFRTEVANLSTELGEVLLPIITPMISKLSDFVGSLRALSPEMQSMIVGIAGVTAVAGPLLIVIGNILKALPLIKAALVALTGPVGLVVTAIVAGTALIIANWDKLKIASKNVVDALISDWDYMADHFKTVSASIGKVIRGDFAGWWDDVKKTFDTNIDYLKTKWQQLKGIFEEPLSAQAGVAIGGIEQALKNISDEEPEATASLSNFSDAVKEIKELDTFQKLIGEQLNVRDAITKTTATIEDLQSKLVKLQLGILPSTNVRQELAETQQQINDLSTALDLLTGGRELNIKVNTDISGIDAAENKFLKDGKFVLPPIDTSALDASMGDLSQKAQAIKVTVGDVLGNLFADASTAIMEGDNVMTALASSMLGMLGGIMVDLGKMALGVGIGLEAIQKALMSLNPALAIGAGVALIALGSLFSAGSRKLASSMGGGGAGYSSAPSLRNTGPGYAPSEYRGQYQDDFKVEFKIGTNELVGVLNTAEQRRNRL
jgi:cell fate (sporulation/competence/biofilm development) regulator YmcA (YheA/YmcA/DUF963 family)